MHGHTLTLDIRTPKEYRSGHLEGAVLVNTPLPPLDEASFHTLEERLWGIVGGLPLNTRIQVYCKKGIRAGYATVILEDWGFRNVTCLGGVDTNPRLREQLTR